MVIVASVFPQSSEILAGSLYGTAFHTGAFTKTAEELKAVEIREATRNGELFNAIWIGISSLHILFKSLSKIEALDVVSESESNKKAAVALANGLLGSGASDLSQADGAWERLDKIEFGATEYFERELAEFGPAFRDAYDVGFVVPTLNRITTAEIDLSFSALYLKRVLNDLRGVWLFLLSGYTSQAAAIAASLYESSLSSQCLSLNKENVKKFQSAKDGRISWSKADMAKMIIRADKEITTDVQRKEVADAVYKHYNWLCDIKHSSRGSIIHDARATQAPGRGYRVMALPNLSEDDFDFKVTIALISLIYTLDCVKAFANALGYSGKFPEEFRFVQTYQSARDATHRLFDKYLNHPTTHSSENQ
jgi:hypothetical protein